MGETNQTEINVGSLTTEAKHQSVVERMMEKSDLAIGQYIKSRDMNPWMIYTDIVKTAGVAGIVYGAVTLVTGEPEVSAPIANKVFGLFQGESGIIGGVTLVKAAEKAIANQNTSPINRNRDDIGIAIDNYYLAKTYIKDFLKNTVLKK